MASSAAATSALWSFSLKGGAVRVQRFRKEFMVSALRQKVDGRTLVAVAHAPDLRIADKELIRSGVEKAGATASFMRNTIARRCMEASQLSPLIPYLKGQTAVIAGNADVALAKELLVFSKKVPSFRIFGAMLESRLLLHEPEVQRLATLPAPAVVYANLIAQMSPGAVLRIPNPAQYLVAMLQAHTDSQASHDAEAEAGSGMPS